MMRDGRRFAAFILTHGRPAEVLTEGELRRHGYTGPVYFIIDNEDAKGDEYRQRFGADRVIEFDKRAVAQTFDTADTSDDRRTIVYARNATFAIARDLGLDYFVQLDDDYWGFSYRWVTEGILHQRVVGSIDAIFDAMLDFLDASGALCVAMSQGGDHMGGVQGNIRHGLKRKAMNSLFVRTDRPVGFVGRINEDVNAYVVHGSRGELFFTVMDLLLEQSQTQTASGGMTDAYRASGTYVKSFYTVIMAPSCVRVAMMGQKEQRMHHRIRWDHAVPKIINERYRKARTDGPTEQAKP